MGYPCVSMHSPEHNPVSIAPGFWSTALEITQALSLSATSNNYMATLLSIGSTNYCFTSTQMLLLHSVIPAFHKPPVSSPSCRGLLKSETAPDYLCSSSCKVRDRAIESQEPPTTQPRLYNYIVIRFFFAAFPDAMIPSWALLWGLVHGEWFLRVQQAPWEHHGFQAFSTSQPQR